MTKNFIRSIDVITNYSCNLRCRMCDGWKLPPPEEPPKFEDYKRAFINLKEWLGSNFRLQIAGGEPFLNSNTLNIIKLSESLGITTSIISNGSLINENIAKSIAESGLDCITISVDSINHSIHDYMRGVKGTHEKAVKAIRLIKRYRKEKPYIVIAAIISKRNKDELIPLIHWAKEEGLTNIIFQAINDTFFGCRKDGYDKEIWPQNKNEILEVVRVIEEIKKLKNTKDYEKFIINSLDLFSDIENYFLRGHWLKNGR